jgi:hypothetical protein
VLVKVSNNTTIVNIVNILFDLLLKLESFCIFVNIKPTYTTINGFIYYL